MGLRFFVQGVPKYSARNAWGSRKGVLKLALLTWGSRKGVLKYSARNAWGSLVRSFKKILSFRNYQKKIQP